MLVGLAPWCSGQVWHTLLWQLGFTASDPGRGPIPLVSHAVAATHVQNRGRLAQMLAQGASSLAKKKKTNRRQGDQSGGSCSGQARDDEGLH